MPSEDDSERATMMEMCVSKEWLFQELRSDASRLVILDCRSSNEYGESHIRHAVNFSIPSIMLRRLAAGKIDLMSTIKCPELKAKIKNAYKENVFVVYGGFNVTEQHTRTQQQSASFTASDTLHVLAKHLVQDGCQVACLEGGFCSFRSCYPEWCESCTELMVSDADPGSMEVVPLMGLRSLRISATSQLPERQQQRHLGSSCSSAATSSTDSSDSDDRCDSSLGLEEDRDFPVLILPHLFLGNAATSEDSEALSRHSIEYILNVTADLPNVFEDSGSIKYMKIPIADHWKENLASFFPKAIEFIGTESQEMKSESGTVSDNAVAQTTSTTAEARCCTDPDCKCPAHFLSPLAIGTSPDSGIEFDRWTSAPGE
ncbi:dual specificity protein phosphatase Mpk3 isoform X2 [Cryptotermes secundus]|uniref:dual specificity protein phosphatase Mpk3 isoform X2 n=1 Tax=Cryptotermes secundus TaxID=105785 RepID=UPI001454DFDA|nr:dual specificity protein phosphatase Mpk3 isoform X2 [Cryptotermes secundus]